MRIARARRRSLRAPSIAFESYEFRCASTPVESSGRTTLRLSRRRSTHTRSLRRLSRQKTNKKKACHTAVHSSFPFVRLVSADTMIGKTLSRAAISFVSFDVYLPRRASFSRRCHLSESFETPSCCPRAQRRDCFHDFTTASRFREALVSLFAKNVTCRLLRVGQVPVHPEGLHARVRLFFI